MQTDHIDLYQSHDDDTTTPFEDTLGTYADLIRAGKVRAIGASNHSAARLAQALDTSERFGLPRYETLQPLYNLADREPYEAELEPLVRARGVGVINFFGLARGFLTGKYRSEADLAKSPRGGGVKQAYFNERGFRILAALDDAAAALQRHAGAGGAGVADGAAGPHGADRQRHVGGAVRMNSRVAASLQLDAPTIAALDRASAWR